MLQLIIMYLNMDKIIRAEYKIIILNVYSVIVQWMGLNGHITAPIISKSRLISAARMDGLAVTKCIMYSVQLEWMG